MNKKDLRKKYIAVRRKIAEKNSKEKIIIDKVLNLKQYKSAKKVGLYCAYNGEVNIDEIIKLSLDFNKIVAIPTVIDQHNMVFCRIKSLDELNKLNMYGIRETNTYDLVDNFDLIIVPGIVFDVNKNRIGYGKGYYDNYLRINKAYKLGVCFQEQIIDNICIDKSDIKLDKVITDKTEM